MNRILTDGEEMLRYLGAFAVGMANAVPGHVVAADLTRQTGRPWSWRRVMQIKKHLVEVRGVNVIGWRGGQGYPKGISLPKDDHEWKLYLAQDGRALSSQAKQHREFKRTVIRDRSGQAVLFA